MAGTNAIGLQWGDEGKGKVVDYLAPDHDYNARYNGAHNAGHTVKVEGREYILHHIPSGILHPNVKCVAGNGMLFDPGEGLKELDGLSEQEVSLENFYISDLMHLIFPYHKRLDGASRREGKETLSQRIDTTKRGIGPAYEDKFARRGFRWKDVFANDFSERLKEVVDFKNHVLRYYGLEEYPPEQVQEMSEQYREYGEKLKPHITDTVAMLNEAVRKNQSILFEGAQGVLLDIDFGTYPFVTSSHPGIHGVGEGTGLDPRVVEEVIGVVKAYTTRVGEGPFATEIHGDQGEFIRKKGGEYGATTGRPRRCGWTDIDLTARIAEMNGTDKLAVTKLDVLGGIEFPMFDGQGEVVGRFKYPEMTDEDIRRAVDGGVDYLPIGMTGYLKHIAVGTATPVAIASLGAERWKTVTKGVQEMTQDAIDKSA